MNKSIKNLSLVLLVSASFVMAEETPEAVVKSVEVVRSTGSEVQEATKPVVEEKVEMTKPVDANEEASKPVEEKVEVVKPTGSENVMKKIAVAAHEAKTESEDTK